MGRKVVNETIDLIKGIQKKRSVYLAFLFAFIIAAFLPYIVYSEHNTRCKFGKGDIVRFYMRSSEHTVIDLVGRDSTGKYIYCHVVLQYSLMYTIGIKWPKSCTLFTADNDGMSG